MSTWPAPCPFARDELGEGHGERWAGVAPEHRLRLASASSPRSSLGANTEVPAGRALSPGVDGPMEMLRVRRRPRRQCMGPLSGVTMSCRVRPAATRHWDRESQPQPLAPCHGNLGRSRGRKTSRVGPRSTGRRSRRSSSRHRLDQNQDPGRLASRWRPRTPPAVARVQGPRRGPGGGRHSGRGTRSRAFSPHQWKACVPLAATREAR